MITMLRYWLFLAAIFAAPQFVSFAQRNPEPGGSQSMTVSNQITSLAALRDNYRPLLVFAPSPKNIELRAQLSVLGLGSPSDAAHLGSLGELKVVVIPIYESDGSHVSEHPDFLKFLALPEAALTRHRFHLGPNQFRAVLLGLDGGEKKSWDSPVELKTLEATINSMPMRQRELQKKSPTS